MRTVTKRAEPIALQNWKRGQKDSPQNLHYDNCPEKAAMLEALYREQHGLCAYTMKGLGKDNAIDAHIEHYAPQSLHADKTLAWENLFACYPKQGACAFGAIEKADVDPQQNMLSPLAPQLDQQFTFNKRGEIKGETDLAEKTIKVLKLNDISLVNDRKASIEGALRSNASAAQLRRYSQSVVTPNEQGLLSPYCVAISQVLEKHAEKLAGRSDRMSKENRR